jgi:hypothetical protein
MTDSSTLAMILFVIVVGVFLGSSVRNLFHGGHDPRRHDPYHDI